MSFARLEARVRSDALGDLPRRAVALEEGLRCLQEVDSAAPPGRDAPERLAEAERELRYLERMVAAAPAVEQAFLQERVKRMRGLYRLLLLADPDVEDPNCGSHSEVESYCPTQIAAPLVAPNAGFQAGDARGSPVGALASFLRPHAPADHAEDEVRLLSVEGQLMMELSGFPILLVPGTESALVLRSWSAEDDAEEAGRDHLAILEVTQAAANLREIAGMVASKIEESREPLNQIEAQLSTTRASVEETVTILASLNRSEGRFAKWVAPSLGVVILGISAASVGGAAVAGCATCVGVRAALTVGVISGAQFGGRKLAEWQEHTFAMMTAELPRVLSPLPQAEACMLRAGGREVVRRLVTKLDDDASWTSHWNKARGLLIGAPFLGLSSRERPSNVRHGGLASSTSFQTTREAGRVFQVLQRLCASGALDLSSEARWSRPVDGDEGTFARYLVSSNVCMHRDFHCVSRCALVGSESVDGGPERIRYAHATATLMPELLAATGLPPSNQGIAHGSIHVYGVLVTACEGGSLIQVMADIDLATPAVTASWVVDRAVRNEVLSVAKRLYYELQ